MHHLRATGVLILLVLVYLALWAHDPVWDLTAERLNTLKPATVSLLAGLDSDLRVTLFDQERKRSDLLERCRRSSPHFKFQIVDPAQAPGLAQAMHVSGYGQAVVEQGARRLVLEQLDEAGLVGALKRLAQVGPRLICFSGGHAERSLSTQGLDGLARLRETLACQGFDLRELRLTDEAVPETCAVLVIAGPRTSFSKPELAALEAYLSRGGALLVGLDPGYASGLDELLARYGVLTCTNLIIDPVSRIYGGDDSVPVVNTYGGALKGFKYATFFARAQAFELAPRPDLKLSALALSGPTSWAETDLAGFDRGGRARRSNLEAQGPLKLAVQAIDRRSRARLIVFGDSDFMTDAHLKVSGNQLLLLTCLNALGDAPEIVGPADAAARPYVLTRRQTRLMFGLSVVMLPALALAGLAGLLIARRRA